ncbi:tyrosine-type recombinase/integrase [Afipia sp. P52-10]|uniref:tyrosine-type recombinase/integrase n=1 Tax=Afipia sp. P52-10 TaxID=1429916 RepID=UPI0009DECBC5|nr:tyrosine-type recombinase/integrase [Afipia sp. P52-10]
MPPKSERPGYKERKTAAGVKRYWVASQVTRDTKEYPDRTISLPADADDAEINRLCTDYTAHLFAWIAGVRNGPTWTRYDGTMRSLCRVYQEHPDSDFHTVKANTRRTYTGSLKIIEASVGARVIRNLTIVDAKRWYKQWRAPKFIGGPERIDRAHDAISMVRTVLKFGFALGHDECGELDQRLHNVRFERGGAREEEMTAAQAVAFVRKALDLGERDMAIGVAAQFELMLRQKDVIGEWRVAKPGTHDALYFGDEMWVGRFRWDQVPGWVFRIKTSKTRAPAEFRLVDYPILFQLLDAVPMHERSGSICKGEHGLPFRERTYRKRFRRIARAAGIPDSVWSMDSRAGGATEAYEAGADLSAIRDHLTHSNEQMTMRYIRRKGRRIATVAAARAKGREDGLK